MNSVGKGVIKKDAMALVTGQPVYCDDLAPKDCLIVKLLRSPHAYAKIKSIDTSIMRMFQLLALHWQGNHILNLVLMIVES